MIIQGYDFSLDQCKTLSVDIHSMAAWRLMI
ncbi:hypothetical protein EHW99_2925 [Erwinia amylovora]|uniref:Uncharacterized protein n=2 Tax=Erwinia amylovora TaxID=552 RepID=A0A831A1P1_ERWAM|nr:hypothetical protein EaACW_0656 [Erwinia amylovora ACW56400]QJQ55624.1 hypothetical protein EHX00_2925 [Erwinia amylovora]CBA19602.1 hypothetical protein predicted by Glimmer/Critica [Erwinia amylovora CFBP1430]CCO77506.1 hypothetical protein BN432_0675 [Erwinia amylovora Ea356]CCO81288.1 hypothetical protein BN433_0683 [Erwinia amylovora Ea266]CCO85095.1 hypothetical protein BN434_0674 [Erwinia amylovora CFBP 2585]CCO88877.1 hypothetical protein BN435_0671 [Erwinia amylovora 01SFR-BO]CCO